MSEPGEGASQQNDNQPPAIPPTTPPASPKFEVKDGVMMVDGKKVVHESDLIAAKKSSEAAIEKAQTAHNEAIDRTKLELSDMQTQLAAANARVKELEDASGASAVSAAEAAKQKEALDKANEAVQSSTTKVLELRKEKIRLQYPQVTDEQLKDKTSEQLDALEEALKAVAGSASKGPGPYASGGGAGGSAGPMSDMDRAKAVLAQTGIRGVREPVKE